MNRRRIVGIACALSALALSAGSAQTRPRRGGGGGFGGYFGSSDEMYQPPEFAGNLPYDGRFTFARIRYKGYEHWAGREGPGWSHDYPDAEENFSKILRDITNVHPFIEQGPMVGSVLVAVDDPLLFKYPVSYMSEPGGWHPSEKEVAGFRSYLLKGGFMIFDDFREGWGGNYDWTNLRQIMARRDSQREVGPADRQRADLPFVLRHRHEVRGGLALAIGVRDATTDVLDGVPGQRPEEAHDRARQRRQRHRRVVAMVRVGLCAHCTGERDLQAGYQLRDLRAHALEDNNNCINAESRRRRENKPVWDIYICLIDSRCVSASLRFKLFAFSHFNRDFSWPRRSRLFRRHQHSNPTTTSRSPTG